MSELNVLYATDKNYWIPTLVSISSLLDNHPKLSINIYIACESDDKKFYVCSEFFQNEYSDFNINLVKVTEQLNSYPTPQDFSKAIYYRILMADVLPSSCEEVLYIDSDTIIDGDIKPILEKNHGDKVSMASPHYMNKHLFQERMPNMPPHTHWFNTGVLYVNLSNWNSENIRYHLFELMQNENLTDLPMQFLMNKVLGENDLWKCISPKYNFTTDWMRVTNQTQVNPKIIHFTEKQKPWNFSSVIPYKNKWSSYYNELPVSGSEIQTPSLSGYFYLSMRKIMKDRENVEKILKGLAGVVGISE